MAKRSLKGGGSRARKRVRRAPRSGTAIERAAKQCGSHFFEPDTKRFFRSRIHHKTYPSACGTYFVTSEEGPRGGRRYTVRKAAGACNIDTVGKFQKYASRSAAHTAAAKQAKSCKKG